MSELIQAWSERIRAAAANRQPLCIRGGGTKAFTLDGDIHGGVATMPATQTRWDAWATVVAWCRVIMEDRPELLGPHCSSHCLHTSCAEIRRRAWPANTVASMSHYLARAHR